MVGLPLDRRAVLPVFGAVQYPVRMAGDAVFLYPAVRRHFRRQQSLLQPLLRARPAFQPAGRKAEIVPEHPPPKLLRSPWFRYGFLTFFMVMFGLMLFSTYRVFTGAPLSQTVTLLWVFKLPWQWADMSFVAPWIGQFAFGFFGVMLTSTVLGLLTKVLFRPRSWCVYCPMGTMTQGICKLRNGKKAKEYGRTGKENSGAAEASGE